MRVAAILRTQALEARRNPMLAMLPGIVIVLALIYRSFAQSGTDGLFLTGSSLIMCCLLTISICIATGALCLAALGTKPVNLGVLSLGFLLTLAFGITMGITVGLFSPDQKTSGVMGAPVLLTMLLGTIMPWEHTWPALWRVMAWLPTRPAYELFRSGLTGEPFPLFRNSLVMLAWIAVVVVVCARAMRRLTAAR